MNEPDEFDKQTAELLPCDCDGIAFHEGKPIEVHTIICPAYYRLAIAAALREQGQQISGVVNKLRDRLGVTQAQLTAKDAEIAKLKADNHAHCTALMTTAMWQGLVEERDELRAELAKLRPVYEAARVELDCPLHERNWRGLRDAIKQAEGDL